MVQVLEARSMEKTNPHEGHERKQHFNMLYEVMHMSNRRVSHISKRYWHKWRACLKRSCKNATKPERYYPLQPPQPTPPHTTPARNPSMPTCNNSRQSFTKHCQTHGKCNGPYKNIVKHEMKSIQQKGTQKRNENMTSWQEQRKNTKGGQRQKTL